MKTAWMIGLVAGARLLAQAQQPTPEVTAYVRSDPGVPSITLATAKQMATKIFAAIGVPVRWREGRLPEARIGYGGVAVQIRLYAEVPGGLSAGALAITAQEMGHPVISVSYSRVASQYRTNCAAMVLGYVLAHEMAHVLQGTGRHSDAGILKAHWDCRDYYEMDAGRLVFTAEDVMRIRRWVIAAAVQVDRNR